MMRKKIHRIIFQLLISCLLLMGVMLSANAAEQSLMPDLNETIHGKLDIESAWTDEDGNRFVGEGIVLDVYQVADLTVYNGIPEYTLRNPFAESGINVGGLSASESAEAARSLSEKTEGITPDYSGTADANGCVSFLGLNHGMFLVVMREDDITKKMRLAMVPYLVSVPIADEAEECPFWNYIITSHPKTEILPEEKTGRIEVTKKTSIYEDEIVETFTVLNETFYFGLFLDEEGTQPYTENFMKSVHLEHTSSNSVVFENLLPGTYYVFETDANGMPVKNGEKVSAPIFSYTCVVESESQKIVFEPEWEVTEGKVVFNNIYDGLPEGYYYEPKIRITKKVMNGSDKITVNETFYAGIFSEQNGAYVLEQVVELKQNDTVETGFAIQLTEGAPAQKFLVFETDKDGNRVNKETFGYTVEGEGVIEVSSSDPETEITITNRTKPGETEHNSPSGGGNSSRNVRTGDDSPILLYAGIMVAALFVIIVLLVVMFKSRRR